MNESFKIHRAKWVFPVSSAPIHDGAIMVGGGTIKRVGRFKDLASFGGNVIDHGEGAIWPALVNAHTHLELSAMRGKLSGETGFTSWVRNLIELSGHIFPEEKEQAVRDALLEMNRRGIGLAGDVGNTLSAYEVCRGRKDISTVFFREFLGFNLIKTEEAESLLNNIEAYCESDPLFHIAAHAPYSVSERLFLTLKNWSTSRNKMLSVHLGECPEERELLNNGAGPLKELLVERSAWDQGFKPFEGGPVHYLERLALLDKNTLCVHLVHLTKEELDILANHGVKCCLCPRSNLFLQLGFPNIEMIVACGLSPALGTDSLASNTSLSILDEMAAVARYAPRIPPEKILEMATLNGARALNREDYLGSLEPGKNAQMILLQMDAGNPGEVLEKVLAHAESLSVHWVQ